MIHLVVTSPFANYKRGDIVIDPEIVQEVRAGHWRHNVVRVISKPEHLSGDFFRNDVELKAAKEGAKAKAKVDAVVEAIAPKAP